jgi:hypothetical protein
MTIDPTICNPSITVAADEAPIMVDVKSKKGCRVLARDLPLGAWITASEKMTCSPEWGIIYRVDIKSPENAAGINRLVFWKARINKLIGLLLSVRTSHL